MATVSATVAVAVAVVSVVTAARGEDLRNVIITGFGEMPYDPAPGWSAGGFFQSDVFPVDVNGDDGQPLTMDVALRTRILVEDPNEKKPSSDKSENDSAEDVEKSSSTNRQVNEKNNSLDQDKAKEIEEELLSSRTRWGLSKLKGQRDTQEKPKPKPSAPRNSAFLYHPTNTPTFGYDPYDSTGYNNREYYGDLGEGWSLQDAENILGGKNYNVLTQHPNDYYPPPPPPPREIPPPRLPPSSFYPFPGFGYNPFPPPPSFGRSTAATGRSSRTVYRDRGSDVPRTPPRSREEIVYGHSTDVHQPSNRKVSLAPHVHPYYDDYLSGA